MHDFSGWLERWSTGQTGWHVDVPNPLLVEFASPNWKRVLVPLCGASLDLGWLADSGREAIGVEISPIAARRIFEDRDTVPAEERIGAFDVLTAGDITVAVGNIFDFDAALAGPVDAIWDRAALVALPPEARARYVDVLRAAAPGADVLVAVFHYPPEAMDGPPHAVPHEEVLSLYPGAELLREQDLSEEFAARGRVGQFTQRLYRAKLGSA